MWVAHLPACEVVSALRAAPMPLPARTPPDARRLPPRTSPSRQIVACTGEAQYVLAKPAASYKKLFTPLAEKAAICFEVRRQRRLAC